MEDKPIDGIEMSGPTTRVLEEDDDRLSGPIRRCFVTGDREDKSAMIRFVTGPDGTVVPDLEFALPGRGYYISARKDVLDRAIVKRLFNKGARATVTVPPNLQEVIRQGLQQRCLNFVGLANRSGQAVAGFEKVRKAISEGRAGVLLTASDAGADGLRRSRSFRASDPDIVDFSLFDGRTLGAVFGRDIAVHVAIDSGRLAEKLIREGRRLAGVTTPVADGVVCR